MKICLVGAKLFHAGRQMDRQTDRQIHMTKLIVAFHNIVNASKKRYMYSPGLMLS